MAATGRDSGAAASSCILDAERRLTPSGLLVFVFDRLLVFGTTIVASSRGSGSGFGALGSEEEESLEGSPSVWLSLEGSGVGTPLLGLDEVAGLSGGCESVGDNGGSSGVNAGEGR